MLLLGGPLFPLLGGPRLCGPRLGGPLLGGPRLCGPLLDGLRLGEVALASAICILLSMLSLTFGSCLFCGGDDGFAMYLLATGLGG